MSTPTAFGRTLGRFSAIQALIFRSVVLSVVFLSSLMMACQPETDDSEVHLAPVAGSCIEPFTKNLAPVKIDGGRHLYFDPSDLEIFLDPKIQIQSVQLELELRGKYKGTVNEVPLSINGIQAVGSDLKPFYHLLEQLADRDLSRVRFHLHRMKLNGALPIQSFLAKIVTNKGLLKLSPQGKNIHVLSATVVIKGERYSSCPTPSPTPTPTVTIPPVPPTTVIDSVEPAAALTNQNSIRISFSSDQAGVGFLCSLDGAQAVACSSPYAYSGLESGGHEFRVTAVSAAGIADPQGAAHAWVVDMIPPETPILDAGSLKSITNSTSATFSFGAPDAVFYACSLDGAPFERCESPVGYAGLLEGSHRFSVVSIDAAGNSGSVPASFLWNIDLTPPLSSIVEAIPAASITSETTMRITFLADESASFECSLDNAAYAPCESPVEMLNLADGAHMLSVRPTDVAGNIGHPANYAWSIDTIAPEVILESVSPPAGITNASSIIVNFSANERASFECSFDGAPASGCGSPFVAPVLNDGRHILSIVAKDASGNSSIPVLLEWELDFIHPTIGFGTITPSAASYINSSVLSAEIIQSEPVLLSSFLNGMDLAQTASPVLLSSLVEGSYTLLVTGTDLAANVGNSITHQFTVDLTAPAIDLRADISDSVTQVTTNLFTFSATEPASFECNLDQAGFSACSSPMAVAGFGEGAHALKVRATDLAGNVSPIAEVTWTVDVSPPVVTIASEQVDRTTFNFIFSANEAGSSFECSLDGAAFSACESPRILSGLAPGAHLFGVRAKDAAGNLDLKGTQTQVTVDAPIITRITSVFPAATLTTQSTIDLSFETNVTPAVFVCSLDGAAPQPCTSPVHYEGLSGGNHLILIRAIDRFGEMDAIGATHQWSIDITAPVTSLTPSRPLNTVISFAFQANEMTSAYLCSLDGVAVSQCGSGISFTGLAAGTHTFSVQAVDLAGNIDGMGASYVWTVNPPLVTSITAMSPSSSYTNQSSISFSFAANLNQVTFLCSLDGATAVSCSSPFSYSALGNGAHSFSVRSVDSYGTPDPVGASYGWTVDWQSPTVISLSTGTTSTSVTISWVTDEPATSKLNWGVGYDTSRVIPEDSSYVTSHSIRITGLTPNTLYSFVPGGTDRAGNAYTGARKTVRTNF